MTLVLEITKEQGKRLQENASKLGLDQAEYLQRVIARETADVHGGQVETALGKALIDQWESEIGRAHV